MVSKKAIGISEHKQSQDKRNNKYKSQGKSTPKEKHNYEDDSDDSVHPYSTRANTPPNHSHDHQPSPYPEAHHHTNSILDHAEVLSPNRLVPLDKVMEAIENSLICKLCEKEKMRRC